MVLLKERVEFLEQYTKHLEEKIDENFVFIKVQIKILEKLVNKLSSN